jgi:DnaK suppressor protein
MEEKELIYFKELLTNWLAELERRADATVFSLRNSATEGMADFLDQATADADQSFTLRIRNRERRLVNKIRRALVRIEDESYGICEMCGEDIAIGRLKARPVTTFCIDCKTQMEVIERSLAVG